MGQVKNRLIEVLELAERGYSVEFIVGVTGLNRLVVEHLIAEYGAVEPQ